MLRIGELASRILRHGWDLHWPGKVLRDGSVANRFQRPPGHGKPRPGREPPVHDRAVVYHGLEGAQAIGQRPHGFHPEKLSGQ